LGHRVKGNGGEGVHHIKKWKMIKKKGWGGRSTGGTLRTPGKEEKKTCWGCSTSLGHRKGYTERGEGGEMRKIPERKSKKCFQAGQKSTPRDEKLSGPKKEGGKKGAPTTKRTTEATSL